MVLGVLREIGREGPTGGGEEGKVEGKEGCEAAEAGGMRILVALLQLYSVTS